jgi:hypothetical protein
MAVDVSPYAPTTLHPVERVTVILWGLGEPHIRSARHGGKDSLWLPVRKGK